MELDGAHFELLDWDVGFDANFVWSGDGVCFCRDIIEDGCSLGLREGDHKMLVNMILFLTGTVSNIIRVKTLPY